MSARIDLHNVTAVTIERELGLDGTFWVTRFFLKQHDGSESRLTTYSPHRLEIPAVEDVSPVAEKVAA